MNILTVSVTVRGIAKDVTFKLPDEQSLARILSEENPSYRYAWLYSNELGLWSKGYGNKVWKRPIPAVYYPETGKVEIHRNQVILNRNGYGLVGFAEEEIPESVKSQHNSA